MSALPEFSRDRPPLSIWIPPSSPAEEGPSLAQAFREHRLPDMPNRAEDTIREYETHLRRWEAFWAAVAAGWRSIKIDLTKRINYPPPPAGPSARGITREDLLAFREWLEQKPEFSNRTVNKHLGSLQAIGLSCVAGFPRIKPLPTEKAARKLHLSYDEADAVKRACQVADWPRGRPHPASLYWETAFVGWCVYGFRTQEQVRNESKSPTLLWPDVRLQAETPHPDGKARHELGWIVYTPHKQRRLKPEPLVLPIIDAYRRHLDAIRPASRQGSVFPFPLNPELFYATWDKILIAAGVRPKPGLDGSQPEYLVKHLRKTATRWINDHGASMGITGIGDLVTGHADDRSPDQVQSRVTRDHYDFAEARILRVLTTLPLPPSFHEPLTGGRRRQLSLF